MEVRIQPVGGNFFLDARHRTTALLSKGLFGALSALGFALDWHSAAQNRMSRRSHTVPGVQLDEELFFAAYGAPGAARRQLADLQESKSRSIANGQYVSVQGRDVVFFANTVVGTQAGTTGFIYATSDIEDAGLGTVKSFGKTTDAVEALKNGQVDCVILDNEPAKALVAANEGLHILDTEYAVEDYAIAIAKENTDLLDKVNAALAELKDDGTLQSIVDKYIGE